MDVKVPEYSRLICEHQALIDIIKAATLPLSLPEFLDRVIGILFNSFQQTDASAIMLWDQSSGVLRAEAARGYHLETLRNIALRAGESITGKVFDGGEPHIFQTPKEVIDTMANMRSTNRDWMVRSLGSQAVPICVMAVPITTSGLKIGVLVLEALKKPYCYSESDLKYLQLLSDIIALVIDRERLRLRSEQASETRRAEILGNLSHDLRMPLVTIKGYATALQLNDITWSETKRNEFLTLIEKACDEMESMINAVIDSSLIENQRLGFQLQPIQLAIIANELATEIKLRSKSHRPIVDFPAGFPKVNVDPRWIKQVFRNILDNAIKYSPGGGLIVIKGEIRPNDVVTSISDQGIGISPEDLTTLFEKYFRSRTATTLDIPGTGLGLPIARGIVEAHGGHIWAESKPGEGTTIFFSLPLDSSEKEEHAQSN